MLPSLRLHILALLFLCFYFAAAGHDHARALKRQDITEAPFPTTSIARTRTTQIPITVTNTSVASKGIGEDASGGSSATPVETASTRDINSNSKSSATRRSSTALATPSNINGPSDSGSIIHDSYNFTATPNTLPLEPRITPAFGVGGIILALTGAVYTFIGIKNQWLHTFLSAGYLGALCVTVLILFVMNTPVSNALQGAYLVAIVLTGAVLGGGSTVFPDMTEGLGCLFGGFCFSMWLLVLKPGGLVDTTSGKVIFIVVFTLAAFAAVFSRYSREYGLIIGIAFGGATSIVLGIDCFTRAGLKEFWAYLWDLNSNLFPFGATSYPVTRGMKVEIAAIIVLFLAGIVSQLRLWKIIKHRRLQREIEESPERDMEKQVMNLNERIQSRIMQDRQQWEAVYGGKDAEHPPRNASQDSGVGDIEGPPKDGTKVTVSRLNVDEIRLAPSTRHIPWTGPVMRTTGENGGAVVVRVARDTEPAMEIDQTIGSTEEMESKNHAKTSLEIENHVDESKETQLTRSSSPQIVPLPFKVSEVDADDDNASSVATVAEEEALAKRSSNRLSGVSVIARKFSKLSHRSSKRFSVGEGESSEDLMIPRAIDDDRASSLAATLDGLSEDGDNGSVRSSIHHESEPKASPGSEQFDVTGTESTPAFNLIIQVPKKESPRPHSATTVNTNILDLGKAVQSEEEAIAQQSFHSYIDLKASSASPKSTAEIPQPLIQSLEETSKVISAAEVNANITKDNLPELSKVSMKYRTNEWAKHLSTAETPELDELEVANESENLSPVAVEEVAPVDVEALQQTADTIPSIPRSESQISNRGVPRWPPSTQSKVYPPLSNSESANSFYAKPGNSSRNTSQDSLLRNSTLRSASTPSIHLMVRQDSIVRAKQSYYGNGAALESTPEIPHGIGSSSQISIGQNRQSYQSTIIDDDEMSLSARRKIIRQTSLQYPPQVHQNQLDSHQAKRQSTTSNPAAREMQLASWRASVTQDFQSGMRPKANLERSRSALFQERQAEEQRRAMEAHMKAQKEHAFDERMRRGDMLEAHRDALRKMQAKANKSVA